MTTHVPALPALVAARALRDDATAAARRALDQVSRLLRAYDLALDVVGDLPPDAQAALAGALHRRLQTTDRNARACEARLGEAHELCEEAARAPSPTDLLPVAAPLFEMLSPYLDDAMAPVLAGISAKVGGGCTPRDVARIFPAPAAA
jgi:hypothetical protein